MNISIYIDSVPVNNSGLNLIFTRDKSLDTGSFTISNTGKSTPYVRNSDVTIAIDDGNTLIEYVDFILESDKVTPINKSQTKFKHEITIIERTKLLEGQVVDGRTLLQPQTGTKKTLYNFFQSLNDTVPLELTTFVSNTRKEELGTSITNLTNVAPEFFFDKVTKREAYDEMAGTLAGFVRYRRKQTQATAPNTYPYNVLEIVYENKRSNLVDKELGIEYFENIEDITDYRTSTDTTAYNVINDGGESQYIVEPNVNNFLNFRTSQTSLSEATAEILVDMKRDRFIKLEIECQIEDTVGTIKREAIDITDYITTSDIYATLPPTESVANIKLGQFQANHYIFDRDTQKISGLYESVEVKNNTDQPKMRLVIDSKLEELYSGVWSYDGDWETDVYRITYTAKTDLRFINEKKTFRSMQEMSKILNQTGTNVTSTKMKSKEFGTIQALGNGRYQTSRLDKDLSNIPTLEDYTIDGYGVAKFNLQFNNKSVRTKIEWDLDYTAQNQRVELDSKKEKFDIPSDERTRTRYEVYNEYVVVGFENGVDDPTHSLTDTGIDTLMNTLGRTNTNVTGIDTAFIKSSDIDATRNDDGTFTKLTATEWLYKKPYKQGGFDSLDINFRYDSPNIAGNQIIEVSSLGSNGLTTKPALKAVQYTDSIGELDSANINYAIEFTTDDTKALPIVNIAGINTKTDVVEINSLSLKKNSGELLNFTYELMFKYGEDIILGEQYFIDNCLINTYPLPQAPLTLISGSGRYLEDERYFGKTDHTSAGAYTITDNNLNVPALLDDSWALVDSNNNLFIAVNQLDIEDVFTERRNVYFNLKRKLTTSEQSDLPPATPTNFFTITPTDTTIDLSWDDNSSNEAGFTIEYSLDEITWTNLVDLTAGTESYQYTNLTQNTLYYFRIRAYNVNGFSDYDTTQDSTIQATTETPNIQEVSKTQTSITYRVINFDELDSTILADEFTPPTTSRGVITQFNDTGSIEITGLTAGQTVNIYAQATNGLKLDSEIATKQITTTSASTTVTPTIYDVGSTETTISFKVQNNDGQTAEIKYELDDTTPDLVYGNVVSGGSTSTITFTSLTAGVSYDIYATAQASGENKSAYDTVAISTVPLVSPPSTPSSCTLTATGRYSVSISWANVSDETGFYWQLSTSAVFSSIVASGNVGANVLSKSVSSLSAGTTYYARVRAFNDSGNSGYVGSSGATTDPETAPAIPSNIQAEGSDFDAITVTWNDNSDNETGFRVQISTSIVFSTITATIVKLPNSELHTFTGLSRFTDYYLRVRAENGVGTSSYIDTDTATRTL